MCHDWDGHATMVCYLLMVSIEESTWEMDVVLLSAKGPGTGLVSVNSIARSIYWLDGYDVYYEGVR